MWPGLRHIGEVSPSLRCTACPSTLPTLVLLAGNHQGLGKVVLLWFPGPNRLQGGLARRGL